jgi:hypothetical protein
VFLVLRLACLGLFLLAALGPFAPVVLAEAGRPLAGWAAIEVRVDPPLDPSGASWRLQLLDWRDGHPEFFSERVVGVDGRANGLTAPDCRLYALRVLTAAGDAWFSDAEPFELVPPMEPRVLRLGVERIRGIVKAGLGSLRARVTLTDETAGASVFFASNDQGLFEGSLPRLGRWHALVGSDDPPLRRKVEVEVLRNRRDEPDVEVQLVPSGVEGEVVDEDGILRKSFLRFHRRFDEYRQEEMNQGADDGTFRFDRLLDGDWDVSADAYQLQSGLRAFRVDHGLADPGWLRIVLRKFTGFKGRVVSQAGTGIQGALIDQIEAVQYSIRGNPETRSDRRGGFSLRVRDGLGDVCVVATPPPRSGGFAGTAVRLPVTRDQQTVVVAPVGGTLFLSTPPHIAKSLEGRYTTLFHAGCAVLTYFFSHRAYGAIKDTGSRLQFQIPNVDPGTYSLCAVRHEELLVYDGSPPAFESCVGGTLVPGGLLELSLLP